MALTLEDILTSTQRLTVLFRATDEQRAQWARMLHEMCGGWKPHHFDEVCKSLAMEAASGRIPVPKSFIAVYRKLAQERGWYEENKPKVCVGCAGQGFVFGRFLNHESGDEMDAMRPCPLCYPRAKIKEGWTQLDTPVRDYKAEWNAMSDEAKSHAIDYGEALAKMIRKPEYLENFIKKVTT